MRSTILVIPVEGDSAETEQAYVNEPKRYYGEDLEVIVFDYNKNPNVKENVRQQVLKYERRYDFRDLEIHAQGGLGAYVACQMVMLWNFDEEQRRIKRVFFVGGAPSSAMTWVAKLFHRYFAYLWYLLPIPFFGSYSIFRKNHNPKRLILPGTAAFSSAWPPQTQILLQTVRPPLPLLSDTPPIFALLIFQTGTCPLSR